MVDDSFLFFDQEVGRDGEAYVYQSTLRYASGSGSGCKWYADLDEANGNGLLRGFGMLSVSPTEQKGIFTLQELYIHKHDGESLSYEIIPSGRVNIANIASEAEYTQFPVQLTVEYDLTD